jgi:hypothetical protein
MTGNVYSLPISDGGENKPHPHVVALELQSEVILVPAFSEGGPYVEAKVDAAARLLTIQRNAVGVRLDNAKCVTFTDGRAGHQAVWLLVRRSKVDKRTLAGCSQIGQMSNEGVLAIVDGLIELAAVTPGDFSPSLLKKLRRLSRDLRAAIDPPTSPP